MPNHGTNSRAFKNVDKIKIRVKFVVGNFYRCEFMGRELRQFPVFIVGHTGCGKSTVWGNLFYHFGLDKRSKEQLDKQEVIISPENNIFTKLLHNLHSQLARNNDRYFMQEIYEKIELKDKKLRILEIPGSMKYFETVLKHTVKARGVFVAIISAASGDTTCDEFERILEYAHWANALGYKKLIFTFSKMDSINYSQERYEEIVGNLQSKLLATGLEGDVLAFVPISAISDDNVVAASTNMEWHKGGCLLECIESACEPAQQSQNLLFSISEKYRVGGIGTIVLGKVESGELRKHMEVVVSPGNVASKIKFLELCHREIEVANAGEQVAVCLYKTTLKDIKGAELISSSEAPFPVVDSFTASLVVTKYAGSIQNGFVSKVSLSGNKRAECVWQEISRVNIHTGNIAAVEPSTLREGDFARVNMVLKQPVVVNDFASCPKFGCFVAKDVLNEGVTIATGVVLFTNNRLGEGKLTKQATK